MAKTLTPAELAAALQSMGLDVPEELSARVENSVADAAEVYISERLSESDEKAKVAAAEMWRETLFGLAENFVEEFNGQEKNVGQGRVFERMLNLDMPDGSTFTIRHREPREKK